MTYRPREFWDQRLSEHFDLRGTGETGLSIAYNRACYALRAEVLTRALRDAGVDLAGRSVLDVGCGTGFFTDYYLSRGARVTGLDIAPVSIERLRQRFPQASFVLSDVSEAALDRRFDIVNAFDVLYHITDDERWERALRNLAAAVAPGGVLLLTDLFTERPGIAEHNVIRPLSRYRAILEAQEVVPERLYPTHVLLNRELGPFRFLNRVPSLLLGIDRTFMAIGAAGGLAQNRLLVSRRAGLSGSDSDGTMELPALHYREDFACRDEEPLQRELNRLYDYADDLNSKVLHRSRLTLFTRLLRELKERGVLTRLEAALDVGCNSGMYSQILSDAGFREVVGIDIVDDMIRRATETFGSEGTDRIVRFRVQDAESLSEKERYDLVLCTEVIEHTRDPERVIANLKAAVRPGGLAVVSLPNRLSLPYLVGAMRYRLRGGPRNEDFERHLEYPSHRSVRLFSGDGFRVIATDGTNLFWDGRLLRALYPTALFAPINRLSFKLARRWPFRYAAQFFYVVARRE